MKEYLMLGFHFCVGLTHLDKEITDPQKDIVHITTNPDMEAGILIEITDKKETRVQLLKGDIDKFSDFLDTIPGGYEQVDNLVKLSA
jgi:hypothetical protein